jgi:hypothetical protein
VVKPTALTWTPEPMGIAEVPGTRTIPTCQAVSILPVTDVSVSTCLIRTHDPGVRGETPYLL